MIKKHLIIKVLFHFADKNNSIAVNYQVVLEDSMRVLNSNSAVKMLNMYKNSGNKPNNDLKKGMSRDKIEISMQARDMQIVFQSINQASDIREEKIFPIIEKIQTGNYEINSQAIAKKILGL